jgi:hypothetical protein
MWFLRAEATFLGSNMTVPATKFDYVLTKLPENVISSTCDVMGTADAMHKTPWNSGTWQDSLALASCACAPLREHFSAAACTY